VVWQGRVGDHSPYADFRAGEDYLVLDVALHLPDVAGMRFEDVDHQERDAISILIVELVEGGNLPPEGRSSVAAENEDNRLLCREGGKLNAPALIQLQEIEIGGGIAWMQFAGALVSPESLEGKGEEDGGSWHVRHDAREGLGRLAHRPRDVRGESEVQNHEDDQDAEQGFLLRLAHPHGSDIVSEDATGSSSSF